jgi:NodT family efflux transporter outer membrane factor (OMF) lipoprotein
LVLLPLLAGCTVGPDYKKPEAAMQGKFDSLSGQPEGIPSRPVDEALAPGALAQWWAVLKDEQLNSLIDRAIASNLDFKIALERVREARALRGVAASEQYPDANFGLSYTRSQNSSTASTFISRARTVYDAHVDASWEIDIFGGIRRNIEASDADLDAAMEGTRDVLVSLTAEVARNYAEYRGYQARIALINRTIGTQRDTLSLTESRSKAGIGAEIETQQARAQLATRQSQLPPLITGARQAAFRLGVLLGQTPDSLLSELAEPKPEPTPPDTVPVGLPADLLRRRPDVRRAERAVAAANARIGVATSDLYPRFFLTGLAGTQSADLSDIADFRSRIWSISPSMQWNIFNGWRTESNIDAADSRTKQAVSAYQKVVLTSLEDVESSLTAFEQTQAQRTGLRDAVQADQRAVDLANDRYKSGIGDFLTVLVNQRELYDAEAQLVESQTNVTTSLIAVYKALGGGWDDAQATDYNAPKPEDGTPPTRAPEPQPDAFAPVKTNETPAE